MNGSIVDMKSKEPHYAYLTNSLARYLQVSLGNRARVRCNLPVTLPTVELEPDIAVVRQLGFEYQLHHPYPEQIYWIVDISESETPRDRELRRKTYAQFRIQEYWVLILETMEVRVFGAPQDGDYAWGMVCPPGFINPINFPDVPIDIYQLLLCDTSVIDDIDIDDIDIDDIDDVCYYI
ncbi:MAG: Uma2 family endonuclease [Cyanothece sp. SIO1E1]|nr:Uma2 family endonuclease [Cyanothece sp. SIO1E1]